MYQRWYDQEPTCTKLLIHLKQIRQKDVQQFCARMLKLFAEQLRHEIQLKNESSITSIGLTGVERLYKYGSKRRRWYDQDQVLHKAVGALYTLPPEGITAIGFKLGDTFGLMSVYATVCYEVDEEPSIQTLVKISQTSLQEGHQEAEAMLVSLVGEDLFYAINRQLSEGQA